MLSAAALMTLPVAELARRARIPFRLLAGGIPAVLADFAQTLTAEIRARNAAGEPTRLILPVGPVAQYPMVVEISNRERLSWRSVHVFQMDEWLDWQARPIGVDHPLSFEGFLRRELFSKLDPDLRPPEHQYHVPHPFRPDAISEALAAVGGADVCYGGIGYHGHVAFNEPPLSRWHRVSVEELRESVTRVVALGDDSILVQSIGCAGGNPEAIPPMAVTMGMRDILAARKIRLYCAGGERHRAVFRRAVAGAVEVEYPVTLVQGHADAEIVTDEATAEPIFAALR
ncbi:MAG: 6-phosphogluconolactonase [Bryobacterales bacterium]|nr:6-phosphogluconolactonase [Bryobacterales bacterium]